jgi:hypothetical protein
MESKLWFEFVPNWPRADIFGPTLIAATVSKEVSKMADEASIRILKVQNAT